jgi:hypothetical protein
MHGLGSGRTGANKMQQGDNRDQRRGDFGFRFYHLKV